MIVSRGLRGRPRDLASAIRVDQARAAFSSKGRMRPANKDTGPSGPANQVAMSRRCLPAGFSRIPRCISAMVSEDMKRSSSG